MLMSFRSGGPLRGVAQYAANGYHAAKHGFDIGARLLGRGPGVGPHGAKTLLVAERRVVPDMIKQFAAQGVGHPFDVETKDFFSDAFKHVYRDLRDKGSGLVNICSSATHTRSRSASLIEELEGRHMPLSNSPSENAPP